jgi:Calcium/calmodulin dependent protein kinase II Association.
MKKALFVLGLLFATSGFAQSDRADVSMLIALENAWNQAQLHHDSKALEALVADTFITTDNDGVLMNKAQFLADAKDTGYEPTLMANTDVKVILYKDTAVVAGVYHSKGTSAGKPFDHHGRFTDTWVNQNGKWQCVSSHTSTLKK